MRIFEPDCKTLKQVSNFILFQVKPILQHYSFLETDKNSFAGGVKEEESKEWTLAMQIPFLKHHAHSQIATAQKALESQIPLSLILKHFSLDVQSINVWWAL